MRHLGIIAALTLAGCVQQHGPDIAKLRADVEAARAKCAAISTTMLATEQCAEPAVRGAALAAGSHDSDLTDAYILRREAVAERADRGEITRTEAEAEMAEARVQANSALQQRTQGAAMVRAATMPVIPKPVTCLRTGPTVNCW